MPNCGSQIILCDLPVRFDTYSGCAHQCKYCFVTRKYDLSQIKIRESVKSLKSFIAGKRGIETNWCDWNIPLHWGGMSDPFQPVEKKIGLSLECLRVFVESQYPFVVSTKSDLIASGEYFELIKKCNCVVQFSAICEKYDKFEPGAPCFQKRLIAAEKIAPHKRVIIRAQPYLPEIKTELIENLKLFKKIGVHGVVVEGMKYFTKKKGLIRVGADFCYPKTFLALHFKEIRNEVHKLGLKFYCGENRLRNLGDSLCCCGIEGLGWKENFANLNHYFFGDKIVKYSSKMKEKGTGLCFRSLSGQTTIKGRLIKSKSFAELMEKAKKNKNICSIFLSP